MLHRTVPDVPGWQLLTFSSMAPCLAVLFTHPFDVAKVRLQIQQHAPGKQVAYNGTFDALAKVAQNEGALALQKGIVPALLRESSKNLFRIGMFEPLLRAMHDRRAREQGPPPLWKRVIAGAVSGALGALACNPAELIKTRMQCYAGTASKGPVIGTQHHYNGLIDAFTSVVRNEGFLALYKGAGMSMLRSTLGSGSNLASYSWLRENLMQSGVLPDNWLTDATCSMLSSFITAIVMNPVDVIRTRVYNNSNAKACPTIITTKGGPMGLLLHVVRTEGVAALFKGWFASFIRLGPHFTLTFVFFEQFKRVAHHHQERVANKSHEKLLNELFTQYDANHDNELSTGELVTLLRDHIPRSTRLLRQEQFDGLIAHDVKHIMNELDDDKDGTLSRVEFVKFADALESVIRHHELREAFNMFDNNQDAKIDAEELYMVLKKTTPRRLEWSDVEFERIVREDAKRLMDYMDTDGSGTLDFDEFKEATKHLKRIRAERLSAKLLSDAHDSAP